MFGIFPEEFKLNVHNRKWNHPNMKWNYFLHFKASGKITGFEIDNNNTKFKKK